MNISDFEFLEPAHVFTREDGRSTRLLFLTNMALPAKLRKKHPPQVVYADENNNVLSCDIDRFLAGRQFVNVDPELEQRLNSLLTGSGSTMDDDDEDTLDLDDDALTVEDDEEEEEPDGPFVDDDKEEAEAPAVDEVFGTEESTTPIVQFVAQNELPYVLDPEYLASLVSSYQETPNLNDGSIQHTLFVRAAPGITKEKLYASFSPTHEALNNVLAFNVMLAGQLTSIDWDNFAGVYSCVFYESEMFQVVFVESAEARAQKSLAAVEAVAAATETVEAVEAEEVVHAAPVVAEVTSSSTVTLAAPQVTIQPTVQVQAQVIAAQ